MIAITRDLTITLTGGTPGAYTYTATLKDRGTFTTIKGKQAPNQGGTYAGDVIQSKVTGPMEGYADFSFTASTLPDAAGNAGCPSSRTTTGLVPADSTSTWYELGLPCRHRIRRCGDRGLVMAVRRDRGERDL